MRANRVELLKSLTSYLPPLSIPSRSLAAGASQVDSVHALVQAGTTYNSDEYAPRDAIASVMAPILARAGSWDGDKVRDEGKSAWGDNGQGRW